MFKMSPTPTTWVGFARLSGNAPFKVIRLGCDKKPMVSELMSTNAYGRDAVDLIPAIALALTASLVGPVPGNRLQAGRNPAKMMAKGAPARRFSTSERPIVVAIHPPETACLVGFGPIRCIGPITIN